MAQVRMDIEGVRDFGGKLKGQFSQELTQIKQQIQSGANGLQWDGPDATQFKGDRTNSIVQAIDQVIAKLDELGGVAINNANAQESTSNQV